MPSAKHRIFLCAAGSASLIAIMLAAPSVAMAQSAPNPGQSAASGQPEEIIVHARKREEKAAEVPLAITALGPEALKQQSITEIKDLGRVAPNVLFRTSTDGGGTIQPMIRGQVTGISSFSVDSPVGLYFDGVYVGQSRGTAAGIFDIQDVEISRGAQGTLNGRNNTGGAISFYTKKPVFDEYQAEISGTVGSDNLMGGHVIINLPVDDTLAFRFGYQNTHQDGQGKSVVTGYPFQGIGQQAWRASALWRPSDSFDLNLVYEGSWLDQPPFSSRAMPGTLADQAVLAGAVSALNPGGVLAPASVLFPDNFHDNSSNTTENDKVETHFVRGTATYEVSDDLRARVTAGWRYMKSSDGFDVDGTPAPFIQATNFTDGSRQFTVEPQLLGKAFDDRLEWVAGYFHFDDDGYYKSTTFAQSVNAANPKSPFFNQLLINDNGKNTSDAGYAHGEYAITDQWKIAAGVRYTVDQRSVSPHSTTNYSYPLGAAYKFYQLGFLPAQQCRSTTARGACPDFTLSADYHYVSYEVSSHYDFDENWHGYVRTGRGQKSGGFNVPVNFETDKPFQPEQLTDYEIGVKATGLLAGSLDFNADYFYGDYKQMQRLISSQLPGGGGVATTVINAGAATIQGAEADFNWRLVDRLSVSGFVGFTDAKYDSFTSTDGVHVFDLKNEPFYETPEWTTRLGLAYDAPIDYGALRLSGGWNYQSETSLLVIGFRGAVQSDFSLFDARIAWTSPDDAWEVALYGTNLADEKYYQGAVGSRATPNPASPITYGILVPGDERVIGATFTYRFSAPFEPPAAPAAYTPPPAQPPAPAPSAPRSYLVFFDFNKSDLTPEAVTVVGQAAKNAAKVTEIEVTGHTDTVGSDAYNLRLSRRRAEAVAAELEKRGVPAGEIAIFAKGKKDLLVPTADGVREPQNRRVQIVYAGGATS